MNQSENKQSTVEAACYAILNSTSECEVPEYYREQFIAGAVFGEHHATDSLIQTIYNRIAELEEDAKKLVLPLHMHKHTAIYNTVSELRNLLTLIK